ncbi:MAG: SPOR domain-containing protein [Acidobacteria bacterium]|nr:SPOR domain-containing protein [Acidobacteriota bacterium]
MLESRHVIGLFLLMLVFSGVFFALGYVMGRNQYDGQVRAESTPRATPDLVYSAKSDLAARRSKNSQSAGSASSANSSSSASGNATSSGSGWGSLSSTPSASTSRDSASAPNATPDDSATPSSDWNFYNSAKSAPDDRLRPAPVTPSASTISPSAMPAVAAAGKNPKATNVSSTNPGPVPSNGASKTLVGANGAPMPAGSYVLQVAAMRQSGDATAVANNLRLKHFPAFVVNPTTDKYYHVQVGPYHDVKSADAAKKGLESAGFKAIVKH